MDAVGEGWLPAEPLISRATRVVAIGSCFARYFILWLAEHGFNESIPQSPYNALLRFGSLFESPASIAQQFRWAFGELDDKAVLWIDKNKEVLSIRGTAATGARHFAGDRRPHCYIGIIGSLVRPRHGRAVVAGTSGRSIRSRAPCLSGGDNGTNSPMAGDDRALARAACPGHENHIYGLTGPSRSDFSAGFRVNRQQCFEGDCAGGS